MPTTVPTLDKLRPLDEIAFRFSLNEKELKEILESAGVQILQLSVSNRKIAMAQEAEAYAAITRQFLVHDSIPARNPLENQIMAQAEELARLKRAVEALLAKEAE